MPNHPMVPSAPVGQPVMTAVSSGPIGTPTRYLQISNMFNLAEETEEDWNLGKNIY